MELAESQARHLVLVRSLPAHRRYNAAMLHDATSDMLTLLGPILNPKPDGSVEFIADGAIVGDASGTITYIGPASALKPTPPRTVRQSQGLILPPFLDAHIHIPQHSIRGRFMEGIERNPPQGRLLAGLNRNVFPAEAKCSDEAYTRAVVQSFLHDTLSKGVVGGAAYMTVHPRAAAIALEMLPEMWSVGMVLMNMNCPEYLRSSEKTLEEDVRVLAERFGRRFIVTDRFAVAVDTTLRKRAVAFAEKYHLRMQTHLNEQLPEKRFVEETLYPGYGSYTDVYRRDGLLNRRPILAHCVRMSDEEFQIVAGYDCAIAHCPTSNTLLGSGIMSLERVVDSGIPWAICTDIGASPTTSLLAEMAQFLKVHPNSRYASPHEAVFRSTLAPAQILGQEQKVGSFAVGRPMSFIEVQANKLSSGASADEAIQRGLLGLTDWTDANRTCALTHLRETGLDCGLELTLLEEDLRKTASALENKVVAVTIAGNEVFRRDQHFA